MSASAILWQTSPAMLGRPSSPLNPNTRPPSSSSPLTSPTPSSSQATIRPAQPFGGIAFGLTQSPPLPSSASSGRGPQHPIQTRYVRPGQRKRAVSSNSSPGDGGGSMDFFAEGTTPVEGAMWKEKFSRRVADRERRKKAREDDLNRRRDVDTSSPSSGGIGGSSSVIDEEEEERRNREDDDEIFRRMIVHQRRKAQKDELARFDREFGSEPDYWDEEEEEVEVVDSGVPDNWDETMISPVPALAQGSPYQSPVTSDHSYIQGQRHPPLDHDDDQIMFSSPHRHDPATPLPSLRAQATRVMATRQESEEERWAREAAEAEEAERDMEEAEVARRVEEAYQLAQGTTPLPAVSSPAEAMDLD